MVVIELARPRDLADAVALFEQYRAFYQREPAPDEAEQFIGERLANGDSAIFLARDPSEHNRAVGLMQLYPLFSSTAMKKLWLLNDLYVAESHRRKGVGRSLLDTAAELCRATGARGFFLETEPANTRAQALYESMGMTRIGSYFYGVDIA